MNRILSLIVVTATMCSIAPAQVPPEPETTRGVAQRRQQRTGEPEARKVAIVASQAAERMAPAMAEMLAGEGFEVLPAGMSEAADAVVVLSATAGVEPAVSYSGDAAGEMARALQAGVPGAVVRQCAGCGGSGQVTLHLELGEAAESATAQMDAALAVRDALRAMGGGVRSASKAEMSAPAEGTTLAGSSVTFQWNAGTDATSYWLMIGSWLGGNTIYSADQGSLTSAPVSGLPTDGRTLYVRLWSYVGGQWVSNDYQYKAYSASGTTLAKAVLTAPAAGSTLSGTSATFTWTTGSGVSRYYLFIGQWQGANNIYSGDMAAATQANVTGLPADGSTLYVRLWSYMDGAWQSSDSTVKASGTTVATKAAITSPAPGTALSASTVTFNWNAGSGVTRYYLFVGRWLGGNTLFSKDMGTALTASVAGIPTDGSAVWVRLWSYLGGQWVSNDYSYSAGGTAPVGTKAVITSPAAGSTLPGSTVTFTWAGGAGVEKYWLFVGTSIGNNNIYGGDQGMATSATVSGIPTSGGVVTVRIWSYINGVWQSSDASFRAATK